MSKSRTLDVDLSSGEHYQIRIGKGALSAVGPAVRQVCDGAKAVVISDETVGPAYGKLVKKRLAEAGFEAFDLLVPPGEQSKSPELAVELAEELARIGVDRNDVLVAVGGGVVGDLTGFVASTYKRGIAFVQVPTTLLAMVDASIGGKTAVNLQAGKNLFGTFHQPRFICSDVRCLRTLSDEDWACGFGEVAKSAMIAPRRSFYEWLRDNAAALREHDEQALEEVVYRTAQFKATVVAEDATEAGRRECLNYGHTLAHAIEAAAGYGTIAHGRAVAEGMRFSARLSVEVLGLEPDVAFAQDALLDALGLEEIPWTADAGYLQQLMQADKKTRNGQVRFVLLRDIAKWEVVAVPDETIQAHLRAWAKSKARLVAKNGGVMWGEE